MRLLRIADDNSSDEPGFTEFRREDVPPYAILSHTWGEDVDEVIFKDIIDGSWRTKISGSKIRFCNQQAARDKLEYFWIDTCCIDRSSSAELQESVNSMFHWYQSASQCYVLLSDVSSHGDQSELRRHLERSRWFTRGWTLQELLAPQVVRFFSQEGDYLGDKVTLEQVICATTGIPRDALQGAPMRRFSVDDRFLWASRRSTKLEEDAAYCLMGIFGVYLPVMYGEGKQNAMRRLKQEVQRLLDEVLETRDTLLMGEKLQPGEFLVSQNKRFKLLLQRNGCLVLSEPSGVIWASNSGGNVTHLRMQDDGNVVIYVYPNRPVWASGTMHGPNCHMIVQDDGHLVVYKGSQPLWSRGKSI